MKGERKIIFVLLLIIIILSGIFIYKIQAAPKYDEKLYDEIYSEYNQVLCEGNYRKDHLRAPGKRRISDP